MDLHQGTGLEVASSLEINSEMEEWEEADPLQHHESGDERAWRRLEVVCRRATEAMELKSVVGIGSSPRRNYRAKLLDSAWRKLFGVLERHCSARVLELMGLNVPSNGLCGRPNLF